MAYAGQIITYKIQVFPAIKVSWVTELTVVDAPHFFIDEQRFGPYAKWHHEQFFESLGKETTLMHDKITYKMPFGILGYVVHELLVRKKLRTIFSFRRKIIDEILR
jgi:ligand-binding SRPBCC domain-containing protein